MWPVKYRITFQLFFYINIWLIGFPLMQFIYFSGPWIFYLGHLLYLLYLSPIIYILCWLYSMLLYIILLLNNNKTKYGIINILINYNSLLAIMISACVISFNFDFYSTLYFLSHTNTYILFITFMIGRQINDYNSVKDLYKRVIFINYIDRNFK